jgi:predicted transcriptional regulator
MTIGLSPEARERLEDLARRSRRSMSGVIEVLILQAEPEEVGAVVRDDEPRRRG